MKESLSESILMKTNLKNEIIPGTPFVELYGKSRFYMENHKGICLLSETEIVIGSKIGYVHVQGKALTVSCICESSILITGNIHQVIREDP